LSYAGEDVVFQVTAVAVLLLVLSERAKGYVGRLREMEGAWKGGYFLEEVESWNCRAEVGELTVFKPDVVEVNQVSVTETENVDFLEHLHLVNCLLKGVYYSNEVVVVISYRNLFC